MKIIIDITEETYLATCNESMLPPDVERVVQGIKNGIHIPKGHGRLIDADKLPYEDIECTDGKTYMVVNAYDVEYADTIIEADKKESEDKNERS